MAKKYDVPDMGFLSYGFWLQKETKDGVVTGQRGRALRNGSQVMPDTTGTVSGSGLLRGAARSESTSTTSCTAGGGTWSSPCTAGHFTADASLMAYFGQLRRSRMTIFRSSMP